MHRHACHIAKSRGEKNLGFREDQPLTLGNYFTFLNLSVLIFKIGDSNNTYLLGLLGYIFNRPNIYI